MRTAAWYAPKSRTESAWHSLPALHISRPVRSLQSREMSTDIKRIAGIIAAEITAKSDQVVAAIGLLDEGATVPFIARYRKEVTGGLDDTQLRTLAERLVYLRELDARRDAILS